MRLKPWPIAVPAAARSSGADTAAAATSVERARSCSRPSQFEQRAAAQRYADRVQRRRRHARPDRREHPADLGVVARMVGARQAVRLAAAAAEMRNDAAPADRLQARASARAHSATRSCLRARGTARPSACPAPRRSRPASRSRRSRRRAYRRARGAKRPPAARTAPDRSFAHARRQASAARR